jgi:hypothetical protein
MAQLPTVDRGALATKADLTALEQRMDDQFTAVGQRFTALEQRIDDRFTAVGQRFTALEGRIDDRTEALEQRLLAAFRGELNAAITSQTRAMIFTTGGAVVSLGGLALALARLA